MKWAARVSQEPPTLAVSESGDRPVIWSGRNEEVEASR
jgi:hypothetical protein